jgi:hypothetical protein
MEVCRAFVPQGWAIQRYVIGSFFRPQPDVSLCPERTGERHDRGLAASAEVEERNPERSRRATHLRPDWLSKKPGGLAAFGIRVRALAFLRGRSRTKFSSRTNDGDRFQHSDPACGSLLMRRYQSKWTLLGN